MCIRRQILSWRRAGPVLLGAGLGLVPLWSQAQRPDEQATATAAAAALERQFWLCDHLATHSRLDPITVHKCSQVTERLRTLRFGGDLDAMLAWWRANKEAQHATAAATRP